MKILIIGAGNMGLTYAQGFLRSHIVQKNDLFLLAKNAEQAAVLAEKMPAAKIFLHPGDCVAKADLVVLAVKPQDSAAVFEAIRMFVEPEQIFLSIMAGVKMERMAAALGARKIIRAMPNLPAQVGLGMTAFTSTDDVTRVELVMVQNVLSATGKVIYVESETAIDSATAISGSGPAYVFFFMDAMMRAAREMGFSESEAELLVAQTFSGAVDLYNKNDLSCQEWIKKVASKGGTTEAALRVFDETELFRDIMQGAFAAKNRAEELGR